MLLIQETVRIYYRSHRKYLAGLARWLSEEGLAAKTKNPSLSPRTHMMEREN